MKRKNLIITLIVLLAVGFAAVSTTLYINGTILFKPFEDDFDVYFSDAVMYERIKNPIPTPMAYIEDFAINDYYMELPIENFKEENNGIDMLVNTLDVKNNNDVELIELDNEESNLLTGIVAISNDGKALGFITDGLSSLDDYSTVDFVVTNSSSNYDASVELSCFRAIDESNYEEFEQSEYFDFTVELEQEIIPAQSDVAGTINVSLKKLTTEAQYVEVLCEINATAVERTEIGTENLEEGESATYSMYGFLEDYRNINLANQILVVYGNNPVYAITDEDGYFYIDGLEKGIHTIYAMGEMSIEEVKKLSKSEMAEQAVDKMDFTTSYEFSSREYFENTLRIYNPILERTRYVNLFFDPNGGSVDVSSIQKPIGNKNIELPIPVHENSELTFKGWYTSKTGGVAINSSNIESITESQIVYALWLANCEEGKVCVISGDGTSMGDMLSIGSETFYVLSNDGINITMMSEYNLYVGGEISYSTGSRVYTAYENPTGIQDSSMIGWTSSEDVVWNGVTLFSSDEQKGTNYSSYSGSIVEGYVNNYSTYLANTLNVENSATLISKEELESIVGSTLSYGDNLSTLGAPSWVYSTSYWTRTANAPYHVWFVYLYGRLTGNYANNNYFGVRPVVTISASLL